MRSPDYEITDEARDRARRTAEMVRIRLERGEHAAAIAAVVGHRRDGEESATATEAMALAETGLDVLTLNMLERAGIVTLKQLRESPRDRWCNLPNMGPARIACIDQMLDAIETEEAWALAR